MRKISIVTYLRSCEIITQDFVFVVQYLKGKEILDNVYVFSPRQVETQFPDYWTFIVDGEKTKYMRLQYLIQTLPDTVLLSIDNDMMVYCPILEAFIKQFVGSAASIGWGRIGVSNKGWIPNLIVIDKTLSHSFIRPLLWRCHLGISVPGQCFILRTEDYRTHLLKSDTYLDDLQIGLITCYHGYEVFQSKKVLGNEKAQDSLTKLFNQRKRWAKGIAATLTAARQLPQKYYYLVLLHGVVYHLLLPAIIIFIFFLYGVNRLPIATGLALLLVLLLCKGRINLFWSAFLYCLVFPCLHFFWLFTVILTIVRNKQHDY